MKDSDLKLQHVDFDLFGALDALDKKDYGYYDRLTEEQQKKFVPYMILHWISSIKKTGELGKYYVLATEEFANKHMFNEYIQRHPKLQWLMLCAVSPNTGKQFHQYIPHLNQRIGELKVAANKKEVAEYFKKIYNITDDVAKEASEEFIEIQHKRHRLAKLYPLMKIRDIEYLSSMVTDQELDEYEKQYGN
jgi:hypothetical protein